ncbi:hypothetical protein C8P66_103185 [Humitalea rosea]|uniref:Uncharacterized protein n=1 Tax=Humitalea rosea TaxID=990373 RepID=A0A2W7INR8_9PROT|nr:hypothetical protein C8P66_103185 [Humitalea rosea]
MQPGDTSMQKGNVTKLQRIGARSGADLEAELGFQPGRLRNGYLFLVLIQPLTAVDFDFAGITLRSGGRLGNPAATKAEDELRRHVSEQMRLEYGIATYIEMKERALGSISATGPNRIIKILPSIRNDPGMSPRDQYPPGGGGLQWTLLNPCKFLVALEVTATGFAKAQGASWRIGPGSSYEERHQINAYLERVA